jgi:hypothetical protein
MNNSGVWFAGLVREQLNISAERLSVMTQHLHTPFLVRA